MQLPNLILGITFAMMAMSSAPPGIYPKEIPTCNDPCPDNKHCLIDRVTQEHTCVSSKKWV